MVDAIVAAWLAFNAVVAIRLWSVAEGGKGAALGFIGLVHLVLAVSVVVDTAVFDARFSEILDAIERYCGAS